MTRPFLFRFAGVRYVADPATQSLTRVEPADERRPMGPQTAVDSARLRAAELKRRRKGAARREALAL